MAVDVGDAATGFGADVSSAAQGQANTLLSEAEAVALSEVLEVNLRDLVTKEDMHRDMRDLEQRLVIKLGALIAVAIGIVAAFVKLF